VHGFYQVLLRKALDATKKMADDVCKAFGTFTQQYCQQRSFLDWLARSSITHSGLQLVHVLNDICTAAAAAAAACFMTCYITDDKEKPTGDACKAFGTFWKEFGRALKLGVLEDDNNRWGLCMRLYLHVDCVAFT
jgi:hypothetical protein